MSLHKSLVAVSVSFVLASCVAGSAAGPPQPAPAPMVLRVDASNPAGRLLSAKLTIPARPGPLTLYHPKWIPGTGGPSSAVANIVGLRFSAGGKPVAWRRDRLDGYAFVCDVPKEASAVEVEVDYALGSADGSSQLLDLGWESVILYPKGIRPEDLVVSASLRVPAGWQIGTALPLAARAGDIVQFKPASLATVVDSPVLMGAHFRSVPLSEGPIPHVLDLAADSDATLAVPADLIADHRRLVEEATALFGSHPYRAHHTLVALSDHVSVHALEHHESSDNAFPERTLLDRAVYSGVADTIPHELVHAWAGKYRRPAPLIVPDFQQPPSYELQWVYEGLTHYLGHVLAARSGLFTTSDFLDALAIYAGVLETRPGRRWRPLADLAVASPVLGGVPEGRARRRDPFDLYIEGVLVWLEVDVLIREQTGGQRSLDDFCRLFFAGSDGAPSVKPYTLDDLLAALGRIARHDWKAFFDARVQETSAHAPLGGVIGGGYRLVYRDRPNDRTRRVNKGDPSTLRYSLGMILGDGGVVVDVIPDTPAAKAGLAPSMKLVAVGGRRASRDVLHDALEAAKSSAEPIEFLVESGDYFRTLRVDYHGGERFPHLERDATKRDLIAGIVAPRVLRPAAVP